MATNESVEKKEKMVKVRIPREKGNTEPAFVGVNGRRFAIKRGEVVEVPDFVAEVLQNSERMKEEAEARMEAAKSKA